jgi:hypothetical protein
LVVELSLLGIGQDFICFGNLFEFLGRIRVVGVLVCSSVRMFAWVTLW